MFPETSAPVSPAQATSTRNAGLGFIGKHTNLINRRRGSWFFLGEIYTDLPLPVDEPVSAHCGDCVACIDICPTQAIVGPYKLDARRCISYLTIEDKTWPEAPGEAISEWAYGCDICQDVCPWNRFSQPNQEPRFVPRDMITWDAEQWKNVVREPAQIKPQLKKSAMQRAGLKKLIAQIELALNYRPD